jgi:hypothetical protein
MQEKSDLSRAAGTKYVKLRDGYVACHQQRGVLLPGASTHRQQLLELNGPVAVCVQQMKVCLEAAQLQRLQLGSQVHQEPTHSEVHCTATLGTIEAINALSACCLAAPLTLPARGAAATRACRSRTL